MKTLGNMNNRIVELADQVELTIRTSKGTYMSHPEFNKKFAELIIRECADIASINAHQYESPGEYVKKHFGIDQ